MNPSLIIYSQDQIAILTKHRDGEIRLGEKVQCLKNEEDITVGLNSSPAKYVLLGIPEDIGVRANYGRGGAYSAWNPVLSTLLNVQSNQYLSGDEILVLGHIDASALMEQMAVTDLSQKENMMEARNWVHLIDEAVAPIAEKVFRSGKELIVVGGGHNNSFPLLKGMFEAYGKPVHCINCDAHSDMRPIEGRHSGNGFSYALKDGYLSRYAMLGLQEIFNMSQVIERINHEKDKLFAVTYESIFLRDQYTWQQAIAECIDFTKDNICGLELDIDIIQNIPSSAKTSSGITTLQARQYVYQVAKSSDIAYFHIAEAAPVLSHIKTDLKTGKLIAYLITDYIKARNERHETTH
jgi:formiminoglutamase